MEIKCKITVEEPELLLEVLKASGDILLIDQDYTLEDGCHFISIIFNRVGVKLNFTDSIFINKDFGFNYDYTKLNFYATAMIHTPSLEELTEFLKTSQVPDCTVEII